MGIGYTHGHGHCFCGYKDAHMAMKNASPGMKADIMGMKNACVERTLDINNAQAGMKNASNSMENAHVGRKITHMGMMLRLTPWP